MYKIKVFIVLFCSLTNKDELCTILTQTLLYNYSFI